MQLFGYKELVRQQHTHSPIIELGDPQQQTVNQHTSTGQVHVQKMLSANLNFEPMIFKTSSYHVDMVTRNWYKFHYNMSTHSTGRREDACQSANRTIWYRRDL